ncbi:MAG: hypothetical protein IJ466_09320 [Clostridia bacterium]|nr:hypothetical protein [Clostridia bacterium]
MAFVAMMFVAAVLIGAPLCGIFFLALSLLFRWLHKRYLLYLQITPVKRWRRVLSIVFGILAGVNLLAGAAGWIFFLIANV